MVIINNKIILENYTVGVETAISNTVYTGVQNQSKVNLLNKAIRQPIKYASLDDVGFSLIDTDLKMAETTDNVGFISTTVSDSSGALTGECKYQITFDGVIDFNKGLTLTFGNSDYYYYFRADAYDVNDNKIGGYPYACRNTGYFPSFNYNGVKKIILSFTGVYSSYVNSSNKKAKANKFVELIGVDFGRNIEASNIIGDITCYHEISPTGDDLPSGTCDTKIMIGTAPEQGQGIRVVSDNYNGHYIIEQVTKEAQNIYALTCCDDIAMLDNYTYNNEGIAPSNIAKKCGIPIDYATYNDPDYGPGHGYDYTGSLEAGKTTCRQWLANYSACQCSGFTTFNTLNGIKQVRFNRDATAHNPTLTISAGEILGNASYKAIERYAGVLFAFKYNDIDYTATFNFGYSRTTCPSGWYKPDEGSFVRGSSRTASASKTAQLIANYLNGSETEATIEWVPAYSIGTWVKIQTPYNGYVSGFIKSIELYLGHKDTAKIVIRGEDDHTKIL